MYWPLDVTKVPHTALPASIDTGAEKDPRYAHLSIICFAVYVPSIDVKYSPKYTNVNKALCFTSN